MNYEKVYTSDYFSGKDSFFYSFGYGSPVQKLYFTSLYRPLQPYLDAITAGRVLDVGCAYGYMLEKFPQSMEKFGIDISDHAIARAQEHFPQGKFQVGGAEKKLPFAEDFFDVIICNDVLEHLVDPGLALQAMARVLKPGGILYLNTPHLNTLRKMIFMRPDQMEHHISLLPFVKLEEIVTEAGLKMRDHWTYTTLPVLFFPRTPHTLGHEQACICTK